MDITFLLKIIVYKFALTTRIPKTSYIFTIDGPEPVVDDLASLVTPDMLLRYIDAFSMTVFVIV